jgi:uncharacterized coiled-coil DUF342 family protein
MIQQNNQLGSNKSQEIIVEISSVNPLLEKVKKQMLDEIRGITEFRKKLKEEHPFLLSNVKIEK